MSGRDELQGRVDALLQPTGDEPRAAVEAGAGPAFSPFFGEGQRRAEELAAEMRRLAASDGLEAAIAAAEAALQREPAGLVKKAVRLFITHEPMAAGELSLPTVEAIRTEEVEGRPPPPQPPPLAAGDATPAEPGDEPPSENPRTFGMAPPPPDLPPVPDAQAVPSLTEPQEERALDWYREDPFANDHHAHWHDVYPRTGGLLGRTQPRHGELFFYMHQQMLARYETERVIAGLDVAQPFPPPGPDGTPDYGATIGEGYGSPGYTTRGPGESFTALGEPRIDERRTEHELLSTAILDGRLTLEDASTVPLDESALGAAAESSAFFGHGGEPVSIDRYGNLHGEGHGMVGALGEGQESWGGVMWWTETAICDPFFYRWHRYIDDLNFSMQQRSGETNDPAVFAAEVEFGDSPAVALCLSRDLPGADQPGFDFDAFARDTLGEDLGGGAAPTTTTLLTRFVLSEVTAPIPQLDRFDPSRTTYRTTHLVHEPFTYFLRVTNLRAEPQSVTFRTFLAHVDHVDDRRMWIELDKFERELAPGLNLIGRPDAQSSVIKRKGVTAPGADSSADVAVDIWCDCGWPYSLLLPSGSSDGTQFRLVVAATDFEQDREPEHERTCGSMSYCGARQNYPDRRRMGYPFDRPFHLGSISEAIEREPSLTAIDVTIRCENERPPE